MTPAAEARARDLFEEFYKLHPDQKNPGDINTVEKWNFALRKGFERVRLMQLARKAGLDFTKQEYWQKGD